MNNINARITLLINPEGTRIELHDEESGLLFAKLMLTPEQLVEAMSRTGRVQVQECKIADPESLMRLGREEERKVIEFEMPDCSFRERKQIAYEEAMDHCPEGWTADKHYGNQDSFFHRNNIEWARGTIRRWRGHNDKTS